MQFSTVVNLPTVLLVMGLVACGGISSTTVQPSLTTRVPTDTPFSTATLFPTPVPSPTVTPIPSQKAVKAGNIIANVTRVVDGDTIDVTFLDGSTDTVRLLGVDTPETFSANKAYEYRNVTDIACLDRWGDLATAFAIEALQGQVVDLVLDPAAGERGFYGRLLAYVVVNDRDFNAKLIERGYARVYSEGTSSREADYLRLEEVAQAQGIGLWACESAVPILVTPGGIAPTAPGKECHSAYPDVCIAPPPPDLDCWEIPNRRFKVLPPDPHRFDRDKDGVGCEG